MKDFGFYETTREDIEMRIITNEINGFAMVAKGK
jgi:hypothetical protein